MFTFWKGKATVSFHKVVKADRHCLLSNTVSSSPVVVASLFFTCFSFTTLRAGCCPEPVRREKCGLLTDTQTHTDADKRIYTQTHTHTHTDICIDTNSYRHTQRHKETHTHRHTDICTDTQRQTPHTHIDTQTHTHRRMH